MTFTKDYISLCYQFRDLFRRRRKMRGDWYGNSSTGEVKRYDRELLVDSGNSEWFFIPEMDDLFAFLNNQVMLTQESIRPAELFVLSYKPDTGWEIVITLEDGIMRTATNGKSPHEVLLKVLFGMSGFDVAPPVKSKKPRVSVIKQRYREFAWRMELEGDPDLADDSASVKGAMTDPVSQEDYSSCRKTGVLRELLKAFRKFVQTLPARFLGAL